MQLASVNMEVCSPPAPAGCERGNPEGNVVRVFCKENQAPHRCSRRCAFRHEFGNLYVCLTSGQHHICDQTCSERVRLDPYSSTCRLSRRIFQEMPELQTARNKRCSTEVDIETSQNGKRSNWGRTATDTDHMEVSTGTQWTPTRWTS